MIGAIVGYVTALVVALFGYSLLRHTQFWLDFFRQSHPKVGAALNHRVITRSTLHFQAALSFIFSTVVVVAVTLTLLNR
ncbi:MAG: hypothetical protein ACKVOG_01970 [Rhodoglobus sp.]